MTYFRLLYQFCRLEKYSPRLVLVHAWKHVRTCVLACTFMHTQKRVISGILQLYLKLVDMKLMNFPSFKNKLAKHYIHNSKEGQFTVSFVSLFLDPQPVDKAMLRLARAKHPCSVLILWTGKVARSCLKYLVGSLWQVLTDLVVICCEELKAALCSCLMT